MDEIKLTPGRCDDDPMATAPPSPNNTPTPVRPTTTLEPPSQREGENK